MTQPPAAESTAAAPCAQCGGPLPPEAPRAAPTAAPAPPPTGSCGMCGGPVSVGDIALTSHDRYHNEVSWPLCPPCAAIGFGDDPDTEILADILAARLPQRPELAAVLAQLAGQGAPHPCAQAEVTWAALARRVPGLGPYHRVVPTADPRDIPGARWRHLAGESVTRLARELDHALALRTPAPPPAGYGGCAECAAPLDLPRRWKLTARGPLCGACADLAAAAPACCGQCGGPAHPGSRLVALSDRFDNSLLWPLCPPCEAASRGMASDIATLADLLAERAADRPYLAELVIALGTEPPPHPCAAVAVGWSAFARRMEGALGPYHAAPGAAPGNPPGGRWAHLPAAVLERVAADVVAAALMRHPAASPAGDGCALCGRAQDLPGRWGALAGRTACGACRDDARAARGVPAHLDPGRMARS